MDGLLQGGGGVKLVISGTLPNLNDYIAAERQHRQKGAALKRQAEQVVILAARKQLQRFRYGNPVIMDYVWFEPNRRRDKDNISSFGRKVIQDGLVRAGILGMTAGRILTTSQIGLMWTGSNRGSR